jgi:hypothetical protein
MREMGAGYEDQDQVLALLSACDDGDLHHVQWVWTLDPDFVRENTHDAFLRASSGSHLHIMQWLHAIDSSCLDGGDRSHKAMTSACWNDDLDTIIWICATDVSLDIHVNEDRFFETACWMSTQRGTVAKWLHGRGGVDARKTSDARCFLCACYAGHTDFAVWYHGLGGINVHQARAGFVEACKNGHLAIVQYLYGAIGFDHDSAFRLACENGRLETAQWVFGLGGVDVHFNNDEAFLWACRSPDGLLAKWMLSLDEEYESWPVEKGLALLKKWGAERETWIRVVLE